MRNKFFSSLHTTKYEKLVYFRVLQQAQGIAKSGAKVVNSRFYHNFPPKTNFIRFIFLNLTHKNSFWLASVQNRNFPLRFPRLRQYPKRCDAILRYATNRVTSVDGLHPIMYTFHRYRSELRTSSNLLNKKYTQLRCYIFYCRKSVNR